MRTSQSLEEDKPTLAGLERNIRIDKIYPVHNTPAFPSPLDDGNLANSVVLIPWDQIRDTENVASSFFEQCPMR